MGGHDDETRAGPSGHEIGPEDRVRAVGNALPLHKVPEGVAAELARIFSVENSRDASEYDYVEALLMRDSRTDEPAVGSRTDHVLEDWSVSFRASNLDIVLDGVLQPSGATATVGQILPIDGTLGSYRVSVTGPRAITVQSDGLGWFELGDLLDGAYELRAERSNFGVWIRFTIDSRAGRTESGTSR